MRAFDPPRVGEITISGRGPTRVSVVSENDSRYTIKAAQGGSFKLIGGTDVISGDATAQVPKRSLRMVEA